MALIVWQMQKPGFCSKREHQKCLSTSITLTMRNHHEYWSVPEWTCWRGAGGQSNSSVSRVLSVVLENLLIILWSCEAASCRSHNWYLGSLSTSITWFPFALYPDLQFWIRRQMHAIMVVSIVHSIVLVRISCSSVHPFSSIWQSSKNLAAWRPPTKTCLAMNIL